MTISPIAHSAPLGQRQAKQECDPVETALVTGAPKQYVIPAVTLLTRTSTHTLHTQSLKTATLTHMNKSEAVILRNTEYATSSDPVTNRWSQEPGR